MKLLLILGLLGALFLVVWQSSPARENSKQARAAATPAAAVPNPAATPAAGTTYKQAVDRAAEAVQAVEARSVDADL